MFQTLFGVHVAVQELTSLFARIATQKADCQRTLRAKLPSTTIVLSIGPVRPGTWATTGNADPLAIGSWAGQV